MIIIQYILEKRRNILFNWCNKFHMSNLIPGETNSTPLLSRVVSFPAVRRWLIVVLWRNVVLRVGAT